MQTLFDFILELLFLDFVLRSPLSLYSVSRTAVSNMSRTRSDRFAEHSQYTAAFISSATRSPSALDTCIHIRLTVTVAQWHSGVKAPCRKHQLIVQSTCYVQWNVVFFYLEMCRNMFCGWGWDVPGSFTVVALLPSGLVEWIEWWKGDNEGHSQRTEDETWWDERNCIIRQVLLVLTLQWVQTSCDHSNTPNVHGKKQTRETRIKAPSALRGEVWGEVSPPFQKFFEFSSWNGLFWRNPKCYFTILYSLSWMKLCRDRLRSRPV